jgi:hypothetical protein
METGLPAGLGGFFEISAAEVIIGQWVQNLSPEATVLANKSITGKSNYCRVNATWRLTPTYFIGNQERVIMSLRKRL